jgi:DNA-binding CsgD family transcriptional regulator
LDRSDLRTDLAERTVIPARSCDQPETAIELIDSVLSDISRPDQRGRLWLSRARLVSFHGDYAARIEALTLAMSEFTSAADDLGLARALAELALPQGADPPMLERVALGQRSVELATACEDKSVLALCLGSLAAARISMGQPEAFDLWATASDVIESEVKDSSDEAAARNRANWSMAALAYGAYDQARRLLEPGSFVDGKDDSGDPFLHGVRVVYLWRRGRWDEALLEAEIAQNSVSLPQVASVACVVQTAISLERDRRPDLSELEHATLHLTDLVEEHWAPFAHSILMQARATRREPNPARGLISLCQMVIRSGVRIGWDDLLPSAADVDAKKCEQLLDSLGEQLPVGKRAEASLLLAKARIDLAFGRPTAKAQAEAAAAAFEALGEPYAMAKALEAWGHALKAAQRKPVDCWRRAAEVYVSLGADRSLASLIRRSRDSRVLDEYKIPRTQAHSRAVGLTRREKEVAELAAEAYTAGEIAAELGISVRTVQNHLQRIKAELGVRRKTQLVRTLRDA